MQQNALPQRVLVVRLGALGDIVHALPAVAALKRTWPGAQLTWAIEPRWRPLLEGNPYVDRVVAVNRRSAGSVLEAWRELRSAGFDFAVDFQGLIKSALVAAAARPPRIFGFHASIAREPLASVFYSDRVLAGAGHRVDWNLELAAAAGAGRFEPEFPLPPGTPEGQLPDGPFVLANPLSGWPAKQWPLEFYARLAELLRREFGLPLVLNGPPSALASFAEVPGATPHSSSLAGLIDATRRAAAVIGVDSGPLHLAAALRKPGVAIYGPTDPAQTGPYGESITVLRDANAVTSYKRHAEIDASMRRITPEMVLAALAPRARRSHPADCLV